MYAYYINIQEKDNIISIRKMHFTFCTRFSKIQNKGKIIHIYQILFFFCFPTRFLFEFLLFNHVTPKFDIIQSFTTFALLRLCSIIWVVSTHCQLPAPAPITWRQHWLLSQDLLFSPKGPQTSERNKRWKSQYLVSLCKSMTGRQVKHPVHCGMFSNIPEPFT